MALVEVVDALLSLTRQFAHAWGRDPKQVAEYLAVMFTQAR